MASVDRIVDRILSDAAGHEFTPQEARWARIEAAARAVLDAYADPLVQSVGDSPVLVELRAAVDDPCPEPVRDELDTQNPDHPKPGRWYREWWNYSMATPPRRELVVICGDTRVCKIEHEDNNPYTWSSGQAEVLADRIVNAMNARTTT